MPVDPMVSFEQAEVDADERQYEARREQHYAEALRVMADVVMVRRVLAPRRGDLPVAADVLDAVRWGDEYADGFTRDSIRTLQAFETDYGTQALLSVIGTALGK